MTFTILSYVTVFSLTQWNIHSTNYLIDVLVFCVLTTLSAIRHTGKYYNFSPNTCECQHAVFTTTEILPFRIDVHMNRRKRNIKINLCTFVKPNNEKCCLFVLLAVYRMHLIKLKSDMLDEICLCINVTMTIICSVSIGIFNGCA